MGKKEKTIRKDSIAGRAGREDLHRPLIVYDGMCRLCTASVLFVIQRDSKKRFKFLALQSPLGQGILKDLSLPQSDFKTFVVVTESAFYTKSTAALQVLRQLDGLWPALYVFMLIPKFLRDLLYDWLAKHRYRLFGKRGHCFVPDPHMQDRFLD